MFGGDAMMLNLHRAIDVSKKNEEIKQDDSFSYLFPKFNHSSPWLYGSSTADNNVMEDFILIAEFSEQEGPKPVFLIPKDGGQNFNLNEFSVRILSVDHQSPVVDSCEITEDAQIVMTDPETNAHAFIHHIVLNDIEARGYVRPFCISYVTADPLKVMKCYEELSTQMNKVAKVMKYGNRLVFMRDMEKFLEDLSFTQANLLLSIAPVMSQADKTPPVTHGDGDLLNALNCISKSIDEVKDIISNLKPLIQNESELSGRFQVYERQLRIGGHRASDVSDMASLPDYHNRKYFTEKNDFFRYYMESFSSEYSLFTKSKDQKPKLIDVSTIRGKRRFDRSLRDLSELCSWGTKEGLQRLKHFREFMKCDLINIYIDELDAASPSSEAGTLRFGCNTVGANFLATECSHRAAACCLTRQCPIAQGSHNIHLVCSIDSFHSLTSSYQSLLDDDAMYSANSSAVAPSSSYACMERPCYISGSINSHDDVELCQNDKDSSQDESVAMAPDSDFQFTANECRNSMVKTLTDCASDNVDNTFVGFFQSEIEDLDNRFRANSNFSDFYSVEINRDLICGVNDCRCRQNQGSNAVLCYKSNAHLNNGDNELFIDNDKLQKKESFKSVNQLTQMGDNQHVNNDESALGNEAGVGIIQNHERHVHDIGKCISATKLESDGETQQFYISDVEIDVIAEGTFGTGTCKRTDDIYSVTDSDSIKTNDGRDCKQTSNIESVGIGNGAKGIAQSQVNDENHCIKLLTDYIQFSLDDIAMDAIAEGAIETGERKDGIHSVIESDCIRTNVDGDCKQTSSIESVSIESGAKRDGKLQANDESQNVKLVTHNKCDNTQFNQCEIQIVYNDPDDGSKNKKDQCNLGKICNDCIATDACQLASDVENNMLKPRHSFSKTDSGSETTLKKKWSFLQYQKSDLESERCIGKSLLRIHTSFNNLQHVVYSLLSGRPVIIIGTKKQETIIKDLVEALALYVSFPINSSSIVNPIKQMKMSEVYKFKLRGLILGDRQTVQYLIPQSIRRFVTLIDVEKSLIYAPAYQGALLNFVNAIYSKKKTFKSELGLFYYLQMLLQNIALKAFHFYHFDANYEVPADFCDANLLKKNAMLEQSAEKHMSKSGITNSDCKIIKYLAEVVKIKQIEEEFKTKSLTDSPVFPFSVTHQPIQIYKL